MLGDELLEIALEGLAKNKPRVERLDAVVEELTGSLTGHMEGYKADKEALKADLSTFTDKYVAKLESTLKAIPMPKDGVDGKEGAPGKSIEGKPGKDGKSIVGKQGAPGIPGKSVKGKDGKDGKSIKGGNGKDGVGIADIESEGNKIKVKLTDGRVKHVTIPAMSKGGSSSKHMFTGGSAVVTADLTPKAIQDMIDAGGSGAYTNLEPVPTKLGGVAVGTVFDNVPITDVLDMLLYPYLAPAFTSFTGLGGPLEVGSTLDVGTVTLSWNVSNDENLTPNTIDIADVTRSVTLASSLENDGSEDVLINPITYVVPTQHTWVISGISVEAVTLSRTLKVNWYSALFYGESTLESLVGTDVIGLRKKVLASNSSNIYDMLAGDYKWICYPVSMGLKTTFRDINTSFDVAMNPVETVSVTNDFGVVQDYYCHRTYNTLGSNISIGVS